MNQSLQDRYAPDNGCFGCGPRNDKGLRIKSFVDGGELRCTWQPEAHHEAFTGMLNGGIIGALLDCHCNWTAAWHLMKAAGADEPPCTVTAEYTIKLRRPTPSAGPVELRAWIVEPQDPASARPDRAWVAGELRAGGEVCATCTGLFVAVREGHPAYHRW